MWVNTVEDYRPGPSVTRFREGAVVRPLELCSRAMRKMKRSAASIFKTTGDLAGALRHAPAHVITFKHVTTPAHMPATHNTPYEDAYREAGECIINPTPGFEYRPPAQPVDVTYSIMLNHAEDDDLLDRRGGQPYESCEEDSGFGDCSGDKTSDGRVSLETCEELPTRRLPVRPPTRGPSVERPAGRKRPKRKAKPKISPANTEGRDADLVSADTPTDPVVQVGLSAKSADTPIAYLPQADESTISADTPMDPVVQVGLSAKSADTPIACLP
jgi:hypothetical protein